MKTIPGSRSRLVSVLVVVALAWEAARPVDAAPPAFSGRVLLQLDGAVCRPPAKGQPPEMRPIDLFATCEEGHWTDVWGQSQEFSRALYVGHQTSGMAMPDRIVLKTTLHMPDDPWTLGGVGQYEIRLTRLPPTGLRWGDEELRGGFTGTFFSPAGPQQVRGQVQGVLVGLNRTPPGFVSVKPKEHPRLLFRQADLPRLRERTKTPLGRALMERMAASGDAVALGLLFQLTGDKAHADRSAEAARRTMAETGGGAFAIGRVWGYRLAIVAYAYDLCYDAWSPEFRKQAEDYLDAVGADCLYRPNTLGTVNMQPGSNYTVVMYGGAGLAALALLGEPGPALPPPCDPGKEPRDIRPPADLTLLDGVAVAPFEPGEFPKTWLMAASWVNPKDEDMDFLAGFSDPATAYRKIRSGAVVTYQGKAATFKPVAPEFYWQHDRWTAGKNSVELTTAYRPPGGRSVDAFHRTGYFYTILKCDRAQLVQFQGGHEGVRVEGWLSGQHLADGDYLRIQPGLHPYLIRVHALKTNDWGKLWVQSEFVPAEEEQAKNDLATRQAMYRLALEDWRGERVACDRTGESMKWRRMARYAERLNYLNLQRGMGNGGFQGEGEGYTLECYHIPHDYALAHAQMLGRSVTGLPDVTHFVPRYIVTTVFTEGAGRGAPHAANQTYGRGGGTVDSKYLCRGIALCPAPWQPALLWFWLRRLGLKAEDLRSEAGVRMALASGEFNDPMVLVQTYLHYPLELEPANPERVMPRVWQASTRGFYAFRSGWRGPDDIVAQIYAKDEPSCGWNQPEAGCFQIFGLGHPWARKLNDSHGKIASRWSDNVVMLPDDPIHCNARCTTSYFRGDPRTGSGVVALDLDNVYQILRLTKDSRGREMKVPEDGGIHGGRSFAVDYSGVSGAPALFAEADTITGGHRKIWVFQLPETGDRQARGRENKDRSNTNQKREGDPSTPEVRIEGNTFTITQEDASLKATFVRPAGVRIFKSEGTQKAHPASGVEDATIPALHVQSTDGQAGDFFVIITLQRGAPPEVRWDGGKACVGARTVSFDGRKIILE